MHGEQNVKFSRQVCQKRFRKPDEMTEGQPHLQDSGTNLVTLNNSVR